MAQRPRNLLEISDLTIDYRVRQGLVRAVDGVDFQLRAGEFVALLGESGSGKSTIARAILGILPRNASVERGHITFDGHDIAGLGHDRRRRLLGARISLVPQEPITAFDPMYPIGDQVSEPLVIHHGLRGKDVQEQVISLLEEAGLQDPVGNSRKYPFELSGDMLQRALIAAALIGRPDFIVADEPTSALDVLVQKRVLDRLCEMCLARKTAILFITHDLGVAADRADRIVSLRDGRVDATGTTYHILGHVMEQRALQPAPNPPAGKRHAPDLHGESTPPLLKVSNLTKVFGASSSFLRTTNAVTAVKDVSFSLDAGSTLAVVGTSGSGKTTLGRLILGLERPTSGTIDLRPSSRESHGRIQLIAQDTSGAFNPRMTVRQIIAEPIHARTRRRVSPAEIQARMLELLDRVRLPANMSSRKAHELSGGQRQRLSIARALAAQPDLVVCDEPVSALDHSVQQQVLELLEDVQKETSVALLFITHDLAVARQVAGDVLVMHDGMVIEQGPTGKVFDHPSDLRTKALIEAIPGTLFRERQSKASTLSSPATLTVDALQPCA